MNMKLLFIFAVIIGIFGIVYGGNIRTTDDRGAINPP